MSRKDYIAMAKIVAAAKARYHAGLETYGQGQVIRYFETELADLCARDNPRFDRQRFAKACAAEVK